MRRGVLTALALLLAMAGRAALADTYPQGAIAFFNLSTCPSGWAAAQGAGGAALNGFTVVPFAPPLPAGTLGTTVNLPLASGEDRAHTHPFSGSISLNDVGFAGASGGDDGYPGASGTVTFKGTTGASSAGIPYLQLLLCQKVEFQHNTNPPAGIPQYLNMFFTAANCPTGWKPVLTTTGRFIVGLPAGGTPGVSFGGNPLRVDPQTGQLEDRTHTHAFSGTVALRYTTVMLAHGTTADGYAENATYPFSGTTNPASTGFPYVAVSQCQTCLPGDQDPACQGQ